MIRLFQASDEAAVRKICYETALYGHSMKGFIDDEAFITESVIGYHIRYEPESLFVTEDKDEIVGYLSGCVDTHHFERVYLRRVVPHVLGLFFRNHHWRNRNTWDLLRFSLKSAPGWKKMHGHLIRNYPANLHSNVKPGHQGQGIGTQLMEAYLAYLKNRGVPGVHLTTGTDAGKAFFSRFGFQVLGRNLMPTLAQRPPHEVWLMGRKVAE
jgi:GNAT superfamily N-acetyltransferase